MMFGARRPEASLTLGDITKKGIVLAHITLSRHGGGNKEELRKATLQTLAKLMIEKGYDVGTIKRKADDIISSTR